MDERIIFYGVMVTGLMASFVAIIGILKKINTYQPKRKKKVNNKILELEQLVKEIITDFDTINTNQIKKEFKHKKTLQSIDEVVTKVIDVTLVLKNISTEIKKGK